jgi:hypothetical protein
MPRICNIDQVNETRFQICEVSGVDLKNFFFCSIICYFVSFSFSFFSAAYS